MNRYYALVESHRAWYGGQILVKFKVHDRHGTYSFELPVDDLDPPRVGKHVWLELKDSE